jgi:hypothetical protein
MNRTCCILPVMGLLLRAEGLHRKRVIQAGRDALYTVPVQTWDGLRLGLLAAGYLAAHRRSIFNMNKYWTLVFLTLLSGCRKQDANYVVVRYEWGASKSIANVSTALYTIHHGNVLIEAECIGTSANNVFVPFSCSPPLPVGTTLSMKLEGHELICSVGSKEVHLEVISEEVK